MKIKALMAFIIGGALALVTLSWTGVIPMASAQEDAEEAEGEEVADGDGAVVGALPSGGHAQRDGPEDLEDDGSDEEQPLHQMDSFV